MASNGADASGASKDASAPPPPSTGSHAEGSSVEASHSVAAVTPVAPAAAASIAIVETAKEATAIPVSVQMQSPQEPASGGGAGLSSAKAFSAINTAYAELALEGELNMSAGGLHFASELASPLAPLRAVAKPPSSLTVAPALAVEGAARPSYILYGCHVLTDGIGDAQHCIDFAKNHIDKGLNCTPLVLMACPVKSRRAIEEMCIESKLAAENVHVFFYGNGVSEAFEPTVFTQYLEERGKSAGLTDQLRAVKGMLNISSEHMDLGIKDSRSLPTGPAKPFPAGPAKPSVLAFSSVKPAAVGGGPPGVPTSAQPSGPTLAAFLTANKINKFRCTTIGEHGASLIKLAHLARSNTGGVDSLYRLGLGICGDAVPCKTLGFKLGDVKEREENLTIEQRAAYLAAIKNKGFLSALMGGMGSKVVPVSGADSPPSMVAAAASDPTPTHDVKGGSELCIPFLKDTLVIPCYFQEGPKSFEVIMEAVAKSDIAKGYQEVVFVVNKGQLNVPGAKSSVPVASGSVPPLPPVEGAGKPLIASAAKPPASHAIVSGSAPAGPSAAGERKGALEEIAVEDIMNEHSERIGDNIRGTIAGKPIRILQGVWLDTADHEALRRAAQTLEGCSGDNSLEKALSLGHVPLYQVRQWKKDFMVGLSGFVRKEYPKFQELYGFVKVLQKRGELTAEELRPLLTEHLQQQWSVFINDLKTKHNAYDKVVPIINQMIKLAAEADARTQRISSNKHDIK